MKDDDFGFSFVSEEEMLKQERELSAQLNMVRTTAKEKLDGLYEMFIPLLNKLEQDSDKPYIKWPDRALKVKAFRKKVEEYIEKNKY